VTAFTEALRQEFVQHHLRVSVVESGRVDTKLFDHREGSAEGFTAVFGQIEYLQPEDIVDEVSYIVQNRATPRSTRSSSAPASRRNRGGRPETKELNVRKIAGKDRARHRRRPQAGCGHRRTIRRKRRLGRLRRRAGRAGPGPALIQIR
jgi:NAD(P)-dependent dehydrogenase (short-subunit alcohol dehydrogenase family)